MSNPRLPATVALTALGVSIAVAAYVWVGQRSGQEQASRLRDEIGVQGSEFSALKARLDEISTGRRLLDADIDRLRERVTRETEALSTLPDRVGQIEENIQRFVGVGDKVRAAWLLAESEHYMRIANAQLGLAGDVGVALTALGLADDTLSELNDPRLTPVRRLLAQEINELKAVPRPDTEGIVLTLGSLADSLESLPLKSSAPESFRATPQKPATPLTGLDRALAASRAALASLVSVRQVDDPITPLLSEAEQSVLIRSLDLELQLARIAIMRGDAGMFRRSVEAANNRLREHFDLASADVQSAVDSLQQLATVRLPEELPDISGSLDALLRVSDAGRTATVAKPGGR